MGKPGVAEILIVLVIIILLFGPGRITKISKELGSSITAFKDGLKGDKEENKKSEAGRSSEDDSDEKDQNK